MTMGIVKRMIEIQQEATKSQRAFELSIGKTSGYLNVLQKRNSVPSANVISKILKVYPEYSAEWLLTGMGRKYNAHADGNVALEPKAEYILENGSTSEKLDLLINLNIEILDKLDRDIALDTIKKTKEALGVAKKN